MTEPATTTSVAATAGGIMIAGLATGLPAELIFPAFVGALWSLRSASEGSAIARVTQVLIGTLAAAWMAMPVTLAAASFVPEAASISADILRYPVAFALGWGGLSILLDRIGRLMGGPR